MIAPQTTCLLGEHTMKRLLLVALMLVLATGTVMAGGDKNRGDKGKGNTRQVVGP